MPDSRIHGRATALRYLCAATCLLLALTGCSHPLPDYVSKYTPPPPELPASAIALVGSTHTAGASTGPQAWPALATEQLLKQNINVDTNIASGSTPVGQDGQALTKEIQQAVQPVTKLVVLFGYAGDMESSATDLSTSVTGALAEAKKTAPNTRILVIGPTWTNGPPPQPLLTVRDTLKASAAKAGAMFIDPIADGWFAGQPDLIGPDNVTLTDAGHAYLAGKMAPLIAQQLQPVLAGPINPPR